jgi:hypothetical protein
MASVLTMTEMPNPDADCFWCSRQWQTYSATGPSMISWRTNWQPPTIGLHRAAMTVSHLRLPDVSMALIVE